AAFYPYHSFLVPINLSPNTHCFKEYRQCLSRRVIGRQLAVEEAIDLGRVVSVIVGAGSALPASRVSSASFVPNLSRFSVACVAALISLMTRRTFSQGFDSSPSKNRVVSLNCATPPLNCRQAFRMLLTSIFASGKRLILSLICCDKLCAMAPRAAVVFR